MFEIAIWFKEHNIFLVVFVMIKNVSISIIGITRLPDCLLLSDCLNLPGFHLPSMFTIARNLLFIICVVGGFHYVFKTVSDLQLCCQ